MVGRELKTRADFEKLALELLNPLIPHYSKEGARLYLGANRAVYEQEAAWAEAFLLPLWGLVPMWAGGSHNPQLEAIYQRGLTAGTDPKGKEYWGGFHDVDQRFVEMAAVSYGLLMAPEVLWEPLSKEAQGNAAAWLSGINHYECPPCNWMFFGILVNIALKSKNRGEFDKKRLEEYLDYIESCYEGNGWYIDGQNGEKDYYVSFAFHYYSLIYIRFMRDEDPGRCREYEERARIFAEVLFEEESYFVVNKDGKGTGRLIHPSPNTNLMHPKTVIPAMEYRIEKGRQTVVTEFLELEAGNL